jgi:hypothetical protein
VPSLQHEQNATRAIPFNLAGQDPNGAWQHDLPPACCHSEASRHCILPRIALSNASLRPLHALNQNAPHVQETQSALTSYEEYEANLAKKDKIKKSHLAITEDPKKAEEYSHKELEKYWSEGGPESNFKMFQAVLNPLALPPSPLNSCLAFSELSFR